MLQSSNNTCMLGERESKRCTPGGRRCTWTCKRKRAWHARHLLALHVMHTPQTSGLNGRHYLSTYATSFRPGCNLPHVHAGTPTYSCITGYDYSGTNLQGLTVPSDAECSASCTNNAECTFYTLMQPSGGQYGCFLKKDRNTGSDGGTGYSSGVYHACVKSGEGRS
jgi:hypothetical protein